MGSIEDKILRLSQTKNNIKNTLNNIGISAPAIFRQYSISIGNMLASAQLPKEKAQCFMYQYPYAKPQVDISSYGLTVSNWSDNNFNFTNPDGHGGAVVLTSSGDHVSLSASMYTLQPQAEYLYRDTRVFLTNKQTFLNLFGSSYTKIAINSWTYTFEDYYDDYTYDLELIDNSGFADLSDWKQASSIRGAKGNNDGFEWYARDKNGKKMSFTANASIMRLQASLTLS